MRRTRTSVPPPIVVVDGADEMRDRLAAIEATRSAEAMCSDRVERHTAHLRAALRLAEAAVEAVGLSELASAAPVDAAELRVAWQSLADVADAQLRQARGCSSTRAPLTATGKRRA